MFIPPFPAFLFSFLIIPYTSQLFCNYKNSIHFTRPRVCHTFSLKSTTLTHRRISLTPGFLWQCVSIPGICTTILSCIWVFIFHWYCEIHKGKDQYYKSLGILTIPTARLKEYLLNWTKVSTLLITYTISVNLMCQGRKPSVLSTGPNFSTKSGSGKPFEPYKERNT